MKLAMAGLVFLGLIAAVAVAVLFALMRVDPAVEQVAAPEALEVEIAVAREALPAGMVVEAASVQLKRVPRGNMPAGAITGAEKVIGRVVVSPMVEGQVFTTASFAQDSSGLRLAAVIPEGMLAMSVTMSESAAMDGMLYPGSRVNVLASFQATGLEEDGAKGRETLSTILLEDIQVLGVHDRTIVSSREAEDGAARGTSRRQLVTLLVDGKQAEALQLAAAHGSISLAMRNPLDGSGMTDRGTLFSDLSRFYTDRMGAVPKAPEAYVAPEPVRVVEVKAKPEPQPLAQLPAPERWKTVVMRGTAEQTLEFAMNED